MTESPPEKYNEAAVHFQQWDLPELLKSHLRPGPQVLVDLGSGDGPFFKALERGGFIGSGRPVYAVDLDERRLSRLGNEFPYVTTLVASADDVEEIGSHTIDFVISTMVMEHVSDDLTFLVEIKRLLRPDGRAFVTTVYKKKWAWYFRKRDGESVLDRSHLREYMDLQAVRALIDEAGLVTHKLEVEQLWFPIVDPLAFRLFQWRSFSLDSALLRAIRKIKVPIPGYYSLNLVLGAGPIEP